ncbi:MAG: hypothetical protein F6J98_28225 [Moorea sp. SIO4G2]|nr:hypothetical protein [Moorena sp. SIO4G2]
MMYTIFLTYFEFIYSNFTTPYSLLPTPYSLKIRTKVPHPIQNFYNYQ